MQTEGITVRPRLRPRLRFRLRLRLRLRVRLRVRPRLRPRFRPRLCLRVCLRVRPRVRPRLSPRLRPCLRAPSVVYLKTLLDLDASRESNALTFLRTLRCSLSSVQATRSNTSTSVVYCCVCKDAA